MKRHRFIGEFDLERLSIQIVDREFVHQVARVLKLHTGEEVILCDGKGREALARIDHVSVKAIQATLLEHIKVVTQPTRSVILYCALLKRENFEWVVQKATEVGVKEIVPLITRRTIKLNFKLDRLSKISQEAAEQSGRGMVPLIHEPLKFENALKHAQENKRNYFFDISGSLAAHDPQPTTSLGLFIGPEGGWDPSEVEQSKRAGCQISSLGAFTLRAETAAVIATYLACH